jgi:hypothetical protein
MATRRRQAIPVLEVAAMGRSGSTSGKRQREADKAAKAKAKRERRLQLKAEDTGADVDVRAEPPAVVLERLADLHRRFEAAEISFDDYDEAKAVLLRQLVD